MTNSNDSATFDELSDLLASTNSPISAAEFHGLQTGFICAHDKMTVEAYLPFLYDELGCSQVSPKLEQMIETLHEVIKKTFSELKFDFDPLLPEEDVSLEERVILLTDWCRGFVCGLANTGLQVDKMPDGYAKEAIQDLSEIAYSQMEPAADDGEEQAFEELVQYIRVAVQTVHVELQLLLDNQDSSTIH